MAKKQSHDQAKKEVKQPDMTERVASLEQQVAELTADLQRNQADFDNYRKRTELEKVKATEYGESKSILNLLPVIDTIERAIIHIPTDINEHPWVKGVAGLIKQLDKSLANMHVERIKSEPGTEFNPELHQAIQMDEESSGDKEVVAEELQAGYTHRGTPIRHAMVKVTRK